MKAEIRASFFMLAHEYIIKTALFSTELGAVIFFRIDVTSLMEVPSLSSFQGWIPERRKDILAELIDAGHEDDDQVEEEIK